jgi:hypothetical protein
VFSSSGASSSRQGLLHQKGTRPHRISTLLKLGIEVAQSTVSIYMVPPRPLGNRRHPDRTTALLACKLGH